jgi:hypothetical protein
MSLDEKDSLEQAAALLGVELARLEKYLDKLRAPTAKTGRPRQVGGALDEAVAMVKAGMTVAAAAKAAGCRETSLRYRLSVDGDTTSPSTLLPRKPPRTKRREG